MNSSLNRPALSYHDVCVLHNLFWGRNLLQHQQWNYRHIATSAIKLSFQVLYTLPVLSRQEQEQRICVHFYLLEIVYITESGEEVLVPFQLSKLCVLKNEEADNDWLFVFNLTFGEFNIIQWIVHTIQLFE